MLKASDSDQHLCYTVKQNSQALTVTTSPSEVNIVIAEAIWWGRRELFGEFDGNLHILIVSGLADHFQFLRLKFKK